MVSQWTKKSTGKFLKLSYLVTNSGYASKPHSEISAPSSSSSLVTRIPITVLRANQTTPEATNTQTKIVTAPTNCPVNVTSLFVSGTAKRPHKPTTPWTDIAPTGSSILSLRSNQTIERTTRIPPTAPIRVATNTLGVSGPAVIATSPAKAPFKCHS